MATTPSLTMARSLAVTPEEVSSFSPLQLFTAELGSDCTEARVDAMKRLYQVALAMGSPNEVLNQLVPYVANWAMEPSLHEDELMLYLAQELGKMVPHLLAPEKALSLLPILERLATVEETVVREEAVKSVNKIVRLLPEKDKTAPPLLTAMAKRLVGAEWFTAKVSAAGILPSLQTKIPQTSELRLLYKELCQDETPMVRRAAARYLGDMMVASPSAVEEWMTIFQALCADEQDSVRMLAVAHAASMASILKTDKQRAQVVVPVIKAGCTDMSWRVRHNLAKQFGTVLTSPLELEKGSDAETIVAACYASLLQDMEAEVRAATVPHVAYFVSWGGVDLYQKHVAPLVGSLADDVVMEVRSKLALALMDCCTPSVPLSPAIILQTIVPLLENFLHDEFPEVQLHVLTNLHKMSHLLPQMNGVVSILLQMVKATNWRVREAVALCLPHLAQARGVDFFEEVLMESAWLKLLMDPVASVRCACVRGMPRLLEVAGPGWLQRELLPHHARIYDSTAGASSYLTRMTILQSYAALITDNDGLLQELLFFLLKGLQDKVANVRMTAAKGLEALARKNADAALVKSKIKPALQERLTLDEDEDCRHFSQLALEACG